MERGDEKGGQGVKKDKKVKIKIYLWVAVWSEPGSSNQGRGNLTAKSRKVMKTKYNGIFSQKYFTGKHILLTKI